MHKLCFKGQIYFSQNNYRALYCKTVYTCTQSKEMKCTLKILCKIKVNKRNHYSLYISKISVTIIVASCNSLFSQLRPTLETISNIWLYQRSFLNHRDDTIPNANKIHDNKCMTYLIFTLHMTIILILSSIKYFPLPHTTWVLPVLLHL